jgi:hypothetical protein
VNLDLRLAYGTVLESAVRGTFRCRSLGLVCIGNLRSEWTERVGHPAPFESDASFVKAVSLTLRETLRDL